MKSLLTNKQSFVVVRYFVRSMQRYPRFLTGWLVSIPVTVIVNTYLPPLVLAQVLNKLSKQQYDAHDLWGSFGIYVILYFGFVVTGVLFWRVVDYFMWRLEQHIQQDIAEDVFQHMLSRSVDFHANNFGGSLVSQTNKLMSSYIRVQDTTIFQVYPMFIGVIATIVILMPRSPMFAFGLLVFVALYLMLAFALARPITRHLVRFAAAESKQTGLLADAITNISVIKSFSRRKYEEQRFHVGTSETRRHLQNFAHVHQIQMTILGSMNRIISGFALVAAILAVTRYHANIATVFLILSYTTTIVEQLFQFSNNSLRTYNRAFGDAKQMAQKLTETPEVLDPAKPEPSRMRRGDIDFRGVTFAHSGAQDALFDDFNLRIKRGEKIGLVGHSGSGKTTFTRLLLRFSDIQKGEILVDGQNIAKVTQEDLHEAIAYVPQEPLLFHRSVKENIAYGDLSAGVEAVHTAAKMAHADEFIAGLAKGYDTLVGERGVKLSGGQRQRIAIARAMLKNAPILLLDEATSALDSESEVLIQDALWKLMEGRTAIVIAHRLSTIQKMDRIIVLDEGKIVEEGSHKELLARKGTYAKLWAHQSGGFIEE